jgi:hypothetical protein
MAAVKVPLTFDMCKPLMSVITAVSVLSIAALDAACIPARRASRVIQTAHCDPTDALPGRAFV